MRAFVTGSNGFIGSSLVEKLVEEGYQVRCLVRQTSNLQWLQKKQVELYYGDLRTPAQLSPAVRDVDVVFHLAGVTRGHREEDFIAGNFTTTMNLLEACKNSGPAQQKFVFVSSQAAGGPSMAGTPLSEEEALHPISSYGRSKRMAEEAVLEFAHDRHATIIRPPSVYGPRDRDFFKLFKSCRFGFLPMIGDGTQKMSLIYISDLIAGLLAAMKKEAAGEIFFMTSDEVVTFADLARAISLAMGVQPHLLHIPLPLVKLIAIAAALSSRLTKKPPFITRDKFEEMKQPAWLCSSEKARRMLDFQSTTTLAQGMQKTASWYHENGWL
ncbi:NAD-dependent epimerase/dehydratase family protein [candidate division KSB1 bacterium]|nr:NAD-dependent epimerase/dehydratase family protein [candidate division KSB1 bacterium]